MRHAACALQPRLPPPTAPMSRTLRGRTAAHDPACPWILFSRCSLSPLSLTNRTQPPCFVCAASRHRRRPSHGELSPPISLYLSLPIPSMRPSGRGSAASPERSPPARRHVACLCGVRQSDLGASDSASTTSVPVGEAPVHDSGRPDPRRRCLVASPAARL
jgi:hypothetical protein